MTRLTSNEIFSPSNKIHREVGRANDLSAPCNCKEILYGDYYYFWAHIFIHVPSLIKSGLLLSSRSLVQCRVRGSVLPYLQYGAENISLRLLTLDSFKNTFIAHRISVSGIGNTVI